MSDEEEERRLRSVALLNGESIGAARERAELELLEAREALERKTEDLLRRNRDLDQFAYVTAHDLQAPLRAIRNLVQWITEDLGTTASPVVREHLDLLGKQVTRMDSVIEGIHDYSRGGRESGPVSMSVAELVGELRHVMGSSADVLSFEGDDLSLTTNRTQLTQVLQNLLENALTHGRGANPRVRVSARNSEDGMVELSVADEGPGIAALEQARLFEALDTLAAPGTQRAGIGLAIVHELVVGWGGRVWVESEDGRGATFRFTWPRSLPTQ